MTQEILNQDEIENLLKAIAVQHLASPAPSKTETEPEQLPSAGRKPDSEKVQPYDFRRPERVGQEQMRALQALHENLARNFAASLSALMRTIVEVRLTSVDQLTYSEFVFGLENPTCFNLVKVEPLEGYFVLDISSTLLYPIIDRLLGGGRQIEPVVRRPLTEIELRLTSRVTERFLKEMARAWETIAPIQPVVERVESNPQVVQVVPPGEVTVVIGFDVIIGSLRGFVSLCIPYTSIERVTSKLASNFWMGYRKTALDPQSLQRLQRQLDRATVEVVVTLAQTRITMAELLSLKIGDIITTDQDIRAPLEVSVAGVPKFRASPGAFKGRMAVQVVELLNETHSHPAH
ncbi:MAG: flagellar motor switch protein FliM [Pirellulaceae bacterium]|nr:MAG: flagellar motor switch protein FliM [Pirellulaceae bacterium]